MSEVASELLSMKSVVTQVDDLQSTIANTHSIIAVFTHQDFHYSLNMRYEYLIEFLSKPATLVQTVTLFQSNKPVDPSDFALSCKIAYYAHLVLASNIEKVVKTLLDHREILQAVFSIASKDPADNLTSQGYLHEIFKALINDANNHKVEIFKALSENNLQMLIPMIHNLSAANAASLKELLTSRSEEAGPLQNQTFNYLVDYFLQEKKDQNLDFTLDEFTFENLVMIFQALTSDKKSLDVTCCDSHAFISVFRSENTFKSEYSLHFRIILTRYWAAIGRSSDYSNVAEVYPAFAEILNSNGKFLLKKDVLELLRVITNSPSFTPSIDELFLALVYGCINNSPHNDVIQSYCFKTLEQILGSLSGHTAVHGDIGKFIIAAYRQARVPNVSSKFPNKISLHFIGQILSKINLSLIFDEELVDAIESARASLKSFFTPFDTEASSGTLSDFSSIVKIIKQDDIAPFTQSFKLGSNPSNNFWKDWSQEMISASANELEGLEEDGSPKVQQFSPANLNVRMIKTHSMNLISEDADSDRDFGSDKFNLGSIDHFEGLSPEKKGMENQLFSPRNSGLFSRDGEANEEAYVSFTKKGFGTNGGQELFDSYDFLTK
jgi:hypothetical protein